MRTPDQLLQIANQSWPGGQWHIENGVVVGINANNGTPLYIAEAANGTVYSVVRTVAFQDPSSWQDKLARTLEPISLYKAGDTLGDNGGPGSGLGLPGSTEPGLPDLPSSGTLKWVAGGIVILVIAVAVIAVAT